MFEDLPPCRCVKCGSVCHRVLITHQDGRAEIEGCYCTATDCGMKDRNQRNLGREGVEVAFFSDCSHRFTSTGKPSQNESNVRSVAETFLSIMQRDRQIESDGFKVLANDPGENPAVDATCQLQNGRRLDMQITRALPEAVYKELGERKKVEQVNEFGVAIAQLRTTISAKTAKYHGAEIDISRITLLIDGQDAPQLALFTPTHFTRTHGDWALKQGWESIWVVGWSWAKRLDCVPGPENTPRAWA